MILKYVIFVNIKINFFASHILYSNVPSSSLIQLYHYSVCHVCIHVPFSCYILGLYVGRPVYHVQRLVSHYRVGRFLPYREKTVVFSRLFPIRKKFLSSLLLGRNGRNPLFVKFFSNICPKYTKNVHKYT